MQSGNSSQLEKLNFAEAPKATVKQEQSADIKETLSSTAADITPGLEAMEFAEQIEGVTEGANEKVSEKIQEKPAEKKGFAFGGKHRVVKKGKTIAQIKTELLKSLPSEDVMKDQIETELKKEMRWLKTRSVLISVGLKQGSAFELNNIAKKLRELRNILSILAQVAMDTLKSFWLRFVHGIV